MTTAVLPLALKPLYSLVVTPAFARFASRPELTEALICVQRWPRAACILRTFALTSRPGMAAVRRNASATSVPLRPSAEGAKRAGVSSRKGPAEREKEDGHQGGRACTSGFKKLTSERFVSAVHEVQELRWTDDLYAHPLRNGVGTE